jgi:hypothetical protein
MLRFHSTRNWQAGGYCARRPLDRISLRRHVRCTVNNGHSCFKQPAAVC